MKSFTHVRPTRRAAVVAGTLAVALGLGACSAGPGGTDEAGACGQTVEKKDVKLILVIDSDSSAYWQQVQKGAQAVADSLSVPLKVFSSEFDGQTALNTLTSALAGGGQGTGVILDPISNAFTNPIVQVAQQSGAHVVTLWNRPTESHPWDFGGGCWIAHTALSGTESGEENSKALIDAIGGAGDIIALQGVPDAPTNKQRLFGLHETLDASPDVTLLDTQTANWEAASAQKAVDALLAKYPDQIKGIFSANDDMAVGAVEALRAKGLNGTIPVTGSDGSIDMLNLIKSGDALSTVQNDAYGQGAYATAIAYASLVGDITADDLTHEQRDFFMKVNLVTQDTVDEAIARNELDASKYDYEILKSDLWALSVGAIDDATWIPDVPSS